MPKLNEILAKYWGFTEFRPKQREIIESVLAGEDVMALLPTGGGKSVCYQVPALAMEGLCLVISPLIALMKDQVEGLKKKGIFAEALFSGQSYQEIDRILDNCVFGKIKLLYVSPERLKSELFKQRFARMQISLLAVDEAHCVSEWGYDFRPAYLAIHAIREMKPDVPCLALTASATPKVQEDIQAKLHLKHARIYRFSFVRNNLSFVCIESEKKEQDILFRMTKVRGQGIVYVRSRKAAKELTMFFLRNKIAANFYHAGLSLPERNKAMEAWLQGKVRVMVATNAFGMGIDKEDVRFVYHLDIPESLEAYYQEAGRAGRDGQPSACIMYFHAGNIRAVREKLAQAFPSVAYIKEVYQHLANYYRLAIGSAELESFDFDFEEFRSKFKLETIPSYNALKRLEEEGYLQITESFHVGSKVGVIVSYEILYEYQLKNPRLDVYIKAILRLYGGDLFNHFVSISESKLSKYLQVSEEDLVKNLEVLKNHKIIYYEPANSKPKITFLTARQDPLNMPINVKRLEKLKRMKEEKQEEVIHYLKNKQMCRMSFVVEYFGEQVAKDCGKCDVCRAKRINESYIETLVKEYAAAHGRDFSGFFEAHPDLPQELVLRFVRDL